jgi:hypothetical protein
VFQPKLLQFNPIRPKSVALDEPGSGFEVIAMDLLHQAGLLEIQGIIAGIERLAALVKQRADRPVPKDQPLTQLVKKP